MAVLFSSFSFKDYTLLLLAVFLAVFYGVTQNPISLDGGHPYDSMSYYNMAAQVAAGEPIAELRPFAFRLGLPWLVGTFFPDNLDFGFRVVNVTFGVMASLILFVYLKQFLIRNSTVLLLLILYITNPQGPLRFSHYITSYADPPGLFFVLLLLLLSKLIRKLDWKSILTVTLVGIAGCLFREIALCGVLVFVYRNCFHIDGRFPYLHIVSGRNLRLCLFPLIASILTVAAVHLMVDGSGAYQYTTQMMGVVEQLAQQPTIFLLSWLTAFGIVPVAIALGASKAMGQFLYDNQAVAVFLAGSVLLALTSGFHTDRILFWAYPAVLLLFGFLVENHPVTRAGLGIRALFFLPIISAQILAHRMWLPIPDDPRGELFGAGAPEFAVLAPYGDATLAHTYASAMMAETRHVLLIQFTAVAIYLGIVLLIHSRLKIRPETS